jgi:hypothetical protein
MTEERFQKLYAAARTAPLRQMWQALDLIYLEGTEEQVATTDAAIGQGLPPLDRVLTLIR